MGKSGRRTLVLRPGHFPAPHGNAVAHAARCELKPKIRLIGCMRCIVEARLAVEPVEIGTDELTVFHTDAGIIDQIGKAAWGIDLIVGMAGVACCARPASGTDITAPPSRVTKSRRLKGRSPARIVPYHTIK